MKSPAFWWTLPVAPLARILAPWSWLYGMAANLHGEARARAAVPYNVPIISVGNITVGGAGKTPLTQWIADHLAQMGHQVAIVSRGYGGRETTSPLQVRLGYHTADQVGDEPLLLARALDHKAVAVWVGRHRPNAVRRALQAGATVIVLDDAFQRRDVPRDLNLLVINGEKPPFGNGYCLPAGPLREPLTGLARADAIVVLNAQDQATDPTLPHPAPVFHLATIPTAASLEPLQGHRLLAFCGLAHPEKFFRTLADANLNVVETLAYPDHHTYSPSDLRSLQATAQQQQALRVTTTKDATKLPPHFAYVLDITLSGTDAAGLLALLRDKAPLPQKD